MGGTGRLIKTSLEGRLLPAKLEKGELSGGGQAEVVWESDFVFVKHKLTNFSPCSNAIRLQFRAKSNKAGPFLSLQTSLVFVEYTNTLSHLCTILLKSERQMMKIKELRWVGSVARASLLVPYESAVSPL